MKTERRGLVLALAAALLVARARVEERSAGQESIEGRHDCCTG